MWSTHTREYYSRTLKRKEILAHALAWMNLENIILNEIANQKKKKYCIIPLKGGTQSSQNRRDRKQKGGCQGLGRENEELRV